MSISRQFQAALDDCDSLQAATRVLYRTAQNSGFDVAAFVQTIETFEQPAKTPHDCTQNWVAHEGGLQSLVLGDMDAHCPITNRSRREHRPFVWRVDDPRVFAPRGPLARRQASVVRFLRRFKVTGGITTPVHRPFAGVGFVSWMTTDGTADLEARLDDEGETLFLLAHEFIAACRGFGTPDAVPDTMQLSERELECLRWAALGKTDREIGDIIARSENTAHYHIKNAIRKLHANNRTHAVAKACHSRLLGDII